MIIYQDGEDCIVSLSGQTHRFDYCNKTKLANTIFGKGRDQYTEEEMDHWGLVFPQRIIGIPTKTKYVNKPTEYRDNTAYWRTHLLKPGLKYFYKDNRHGIKSPTFTIVAIEIVDSPPKYLEEGILHTKKAIHIIGVLDQI